jgi:hypothetical protein
VSPLRTDDAEARLREHASRAATGAARVNARGEAELYCNRYGEWRRPEAFRRDRATHRGYKYVCKECARSGHRPLRLRYRAAGEEDHSKEWTVLLGNLVVGHVGYRDRTHPAVVSGDLDAGYHYYADHPNEEVQGGPLKTFEMAAWELERGLLGARP